MTYIREEIADAEKYAKKATEYRDNDRSLADMYSELANQELVHSNVMHSQVVRLINDHKAKAGNAPEAMEAVWKWEHEAMMEHTARVRALLEMYKK